ncbi:MAG: hypothetical protein IT438_09340 [Phycisphaerales bacterium]|nr:hypothetical protein [Phycisphaerales bacterium]
MFQRRLLLLAGLGVLCTLPPMLQMTRLTVAKGEEQLAEARKRLINEQWLETTRGRILDRKGRVLALDEASSDITADYPVITGRWSYTQAARKARRLPGTKWGELSPDQRESLIQQFVPEFDAKLDAMWDKLCAIAGVSRTELDDRRQKVRAEVQALAATVTERARQKLEEQLRRGEELTEEVKTADVRRQIREQASAHVLLRNVPESVAFALRPLTDRSPDVATDPDAESAPMIGLHVVESTRRAYPLDAVEIDVDQSTFPLPLKNPRSQSVRVEGVATHVVGWMRSKLQAEDLARRPRLLADGSVDRGHYRPGDAVGLGGVEQAAEDRLRGLRGVRTLHRDTEQVERLEPSAGSDVRLTIDSFLQARIQALFDPSLGLAVVQPWHRTRAPDPIDPANPRPLDLPLATPLNGAVVVIDVASGDILALVSAPSFSHDRILADPGSVFNDSERRPFLNRAIDSAYPPGSIVKPLVLTAAVAANKVGIDERIRCTGHFFPDKPLLFRCWIYKQTKGAMTHESQFEEQGGGLDGADAIRVSCNIFFFELGKRLGTRGIHDWYSRYGVGSDAAPWNLYQLDPFPPRGAAETDEQYKARRAVEVASRSLIHEYPGVLPDPDRSNIQEAILMGIGQGPISWTPLHAADAYATIARRGVRLTPRLIRDAPQSRADLGVPARAIDKALEGLRASASLEHGTTYEASYDMPDGQKKRERIFGIQADPNITVWAKSGTADANPFEAVLDEAGQPVTYDADHAWCVFLVGEKHQPRYAVAVVIEHGGSGGRVAGPIGNQVVHALLAEGYLTASPQPPGPTP